MQRLSIFEYPSYSKNEVGKIGLKLLPDSEARLSFLLIEDRKWPYKSINGIFYG